MRQQIFEEALENVSAFAKQAGHAYGEDRATLVKEIDRLRWLLMRIEVIAEEATRRD